MDETIYYNQDYVVRETLFPTPKVHGVCVLDEDGRANIYINEKDSDDRKRYTLKHEVLHYKKNDHYRDEKVAEEEMKKELPGCRLKVREGYMKIYQA